ncbi:unnamed protein product [Bursaphelenchus okinawaensis]|uniref:Uncharacterized protein n=1 Tax=Bursaphelenchus okinawaensis TaxID=465554 RepID=A0A811KJD4_9BILA|nr:unnamed protein product [Bursaphelenchus okinawaensis]CAG9105820.1 unnamed protein product [Bursaphelenchus okinawaensis]
MEMKLNLLCMTMVITLFQHTRASIFAYSDAIPVILNPINAEQIAIMHPKMLTLKHSPTVSPKSPTLSSKSKLSKKRRSLATAQTEGAKPSNRLMLTKPFWPWP